jgi:hypothetical protein
MDNVLGPLCVFIVVLVVAVVLVLVLLGPLVVVLAFVIVVFVVDSREKEKSQMPRSDVSIPFGLRQKTLASFHFVREGSETSLWRAVLVSPKNIFGFSATRQQWSYVMCRV